MRLYFIVIYFIVLNGCTAIKMKNLKEHDNNPSFRQMSYSISFVGKSNNLATQEYNMEDNMIEYVETECLGGRLKNYRASFKENIIWARFACEINDNLKTRNKIINGKLIKNVAPKGLHLHIQYEQDVYENKALVYLGYFSLMIIPFKNEIRHRLTSELYKDGKIIKKYSYEDGFTVWHSILLLPITPFTDGYSESIKKLNKIFVDNLVFDLHSDNIL